MKHKGSVKLHADVDVIKETPEYIYLKAIGHNVGLTITNDAEWVVGQYYEDINQILLCISTYKQLEDTIPELARYASRTETEAVAVLVPIEQINRVRNLLQKEAL
jgi:hypothetical protein